MKKNKKNITQNYILLVLISVLSIFVSWYAFDKYKDNVEQENYDLSDVISLINYEELGNYVTDNPSVIIYTTDTTKDFASFEEKFANYIKKNNLNTNILYMDMSLLDNNALAQIKANYYSENVNKSSLEVYPNILIVENGKVVDALYETKTDISLNDVKKIIKEYIEEND